MTPDCLTIAVPNFNGARYLDQTLASLVANGPKLRWWLQDNLSTDESLTIARRCARECDTICAEPDAGQTDALNRAMSRMGGEIIGFLNSDDCLLPDTAESVLAFFAENPDVDLVCGRVEWIDESGRVTGTHAGHIESLEEALDIYGVWWKQRQWVQPEVFYRRSLWERVGGFDRTYHFAFDYDLWVRCFRAGARVAHLPQTLVRFRRHAAQKSNATDRAADELRAIVQKQLAASPPIRASAKRRIHAQVSYDLYQGRKAHWAGKPRPAFASVLLRHPSWLLSGEVRERILRACRLPPFKKART